MKLVDMKDIYYYLVSRLNSPSIHRSCPYDLPKTSMKAFVVGKLAPLCHVSKSDKNGLKWKVLAIYTVLRKPHLNTGWQCAATQQHVIPLVGY